MDLVQPMFIFPVPISVHDCVYTAQHMYNPTE